MSSGIVGIKKSELEAKIAKLKTLSENITSSANTAGISLAAGPPAQGTENAPFNQSKGASASSMVLFQSGLKSAVYNFFQLVNRTSEYLTGVKNSFTETDENISNAINGSGEG